MFSGKTYALSIVKRVALPVIAVAVVSGCNLPKIPVSSDPTVKFPLVVSDETRSISIDIPIDGGAMSVAQNDGVRRFVQDYITRGKGSVIVETSTLTGGGTATENHANRVADYLTDYGVRENEITLIPGAISGSSPSTVTLTFTASTVSIPECGQWDSGSSYNWANKTHANFGCFYRRNLGLMIANPTDLVRSATMTPRDPESGQRVLDLAREGAPTERAMNAGQARSYAGTTE